MMALPPSWSKNKMPKISETKTNVMRILDAHGVKYSSHEYVPENAPDAVAVARSLNQNPYQVFKTLVTVSRSNKYYVFMVPSCAELDLKKAALSVGEKSLNMLHLRDLQSITGYVHGGCSPIGMKKQFITVADVSINNFETIIFSAGRIGYQVEMSPSDLLRIIPIKLGAIIS